MEELPPSIEAVLFDDRGCEYLLLLGDIGSVARSEHHQSFRKWFIRLRRKYKLVFWIAGNHEFWGGSTPYGIQIMRDFAADPAMKGRLSVLEKERFDMVQYGVNVSFLGCTLWMCIRRHQCLGDGQMISGNSKEGHNKRFEESLAWLKNEV